ncbi:hypothetical protein [Enterovirga aerilata]|uniref:Uncharacterized protein n=1 Tax=Enterovirga aerilata TaxID=2730920 RepID=A0A849I1P7_9HYPH|nr:hypothetical protein [Enterovirga sp. DB1703]NNM71524.1 hypothetical protein [Enterovirga sp. DB1703]
MARFIGNATGRTLAETVEKAAGHLAEKEMPKATLVQRGKRFSPRPPARNEAEPAAQRTEPAAEDAQD